MMSSTYCRQKKQSGAVLMVSLIILILLTIIALASAQNALFQERLAGNQRNIDMASQAAETALREAEQNIVAANDEPTFGQNGWAKIERSGNIGDLDVQQKPDFFDTATNLGSVDKAKYPSIIKNASKPALYSITQVNLGPNIYDGLSTSRDGRDVYMYFVHAKGYGADGRTQVVLKSTFKN